MNYMNCKWNTDEGIYKWINSPSPNELTVLSYEKWAST